MAVYNVTAGHSYKVVGAHGFIKEEEWTRKIADKVIWFLRQAGHTVYDCTDNDGTTQNQNLANIVKKCNQHKVATDVHIHLNSASASATGTEVLYYDQKATAARVSEAVASTLGIRNRGAKENKGLYVLRNTKSPAILIEVCFVTNQGDANAIQAKLAPVGKAIAEAITGKTITTKPTPNKPSTSKPSKPSPAKKPDRQYAEAGVFTATTTVAIKYTPKVSATQVARLTPGELVHYHRVAFSDGYVWVQYMRSIGRLAWACAGKASADNSKNAEKYGTFK